MNLPGLEVSMNTKLMLKRDLKEKNEHVNIAIDRFLPRKDEYPKKIHKAMRHTLFAGGKRLRPYLMIRVFNLFSEDTQQIVEIAAALELIHTYTLIHDDLPEIDNDDMRRGKPTCHILYGADLALLAGDALLVNAMEIISLVSLDHRILKKVLAEITSKCGSTGLIGGQMIDILNEGKQGSVETLNYIHTNKTVSLFQLCSKIACYVAKAKEDDMRILEEYGYCIGLAFQIIDDILDIEGDDKVLGKTTGKDLKSHKLTYPAIHGLEKSKEEAERLIERADNLISHYGDRSFYLKLLNRYILTRIY